MTSVKKVTPGGYMTVYLALTVTVIMALCLALIEAVGIGESHWKQNASWISEWIVSWLNIIENCRNSTICLP